MEFSFLSHRSEVRDRCLPVQRRRPQRPPGQHGIGIMLMMIAQPHNPVRNPKSVDGSNATGTAFTGVDNSGNALVRILDRVN